MKKGLKRSLIAGALALTLLFVASISSMADTIDLNKTCSMTIAPGSETQLEDLGEANVVYDVYLVASATSIEGYDTYGYKTEAAYADMASVLENEEAVAALDNSDWKDLANQAGEITLLEGSTIAKVKDGVPAGEKMEDLKAGLYLVIARTDGLENYVTTVTDEQGNKWVATIAQSLKYEYTYLPELVSLPTKDPDPETGVRRTSNAGDWVYDLTGAAMKPTQEDRYGNLEITKTLDRIESESPVTFVFHVTATKTYGNSEVKVYDDVCGLYFDGPGTKTLKIEGKIPVGSQVTVEEIYSGASYEVVGDSSKTVKIVPLDEETASVNFENDYDGGLVPGYGIINEFTYVETEAGSAEWVLSNQTPAQD